jgi:hypothetical protein
VTTAAEVEAVLNQSGTRESRILNFAAVLARESREEVIVVGGSAIEVYTPGAYASGDIDLVGDKDAILAVLTKWKFTEHGRLWIRKDWRIAIDVVGPTYTGSLFRTSLTQTKYGPVRIAAIEDLLIKRLALAKHWRAKAALDEAALLWKDYKERMDMNYVEECARNYDVIDILKDFRSAMDAPRVAAKRARSKGSRPGRK